MSELKLNRRAEMSDLSIDSINKIKLDEKIEEFKKLNSKSMRYTLQMMANRFAFGKEMAEDEIELLKTLHNIYIETTKKEKISKHKGRK